MFYGWSSEDPVWSISNFCLTGNTNIERYKTQLMLDILALPLVIKNCKSFYNQPIFKRAITDIIVFAIIGVLQSQIPDYCLSVHPHDP